MFLDSTKVILYESTVSNNETGPRKGSTGYAVFSTQKIGWSLLDTEKLPGAAAMSSIRRHVYETDMIGDLQYKTKKGLIFFNRFGFEKKERLECKEVINIFPMKLNGGFEKIKSPFFTKKAKVFLQEKYGTKIPIVIALPVIETYNLLEKKEYNAWANSILKNELLQKLCRGPKFPKTSLLNKNVISNYIKKKGKIPSLQELTYDKNRILYDLQQILSFMRHLYSHCIDESFWENFIYQRDKSINNTLKTPGYEKEKLKVRLTLIEDWAVKTKCNLT